MWIMNFLPPFLMCMLPPYPGTLKNGLMFLFERLKLLVKWPEHEQLYKTMPKEFKNFSKCIVIIDCFEVFMERPKGLMARAQTWSNYKHHNPVEFFWWNCSSGLNYIHFKGLGWPCLGSISNRKVWYFGSSFTGRPYFGRSGVQRT